LRHYVLVIEVDGGGHADQEQAAYDRQRTEILEQEGLRVIRFWNHEVLRETEAVVGAIAWALNALTPSPSPKGGGESVPSPSGRGPG